MLCAGVIALCCAVLAVLLLWIYSTYLLVHMKKRWGKTKKRTSINQREQRISGRFPNKCIVLGIYRVRRAEKWENTPRVPPK